MKCAAPECDRPATRAELCDPHYMQSVRAKAEGKRVRFKEPRAAPGSAGKPLLVSPTAEDRAEFERAAKAAGLSVPKWLLEQGRRAIRGWGKAGGTGH